MRRYTITLRPSPFDFKPARFALLIRDQDGAYVWHYRPDLDPTYRNETVRMCAEAVHLAKRQGHTLTICRVIESEPKTANPLRLRTQD